MVRAVDSMIVRPLSHLAVKRVPWSEAILCGILSVDQTLCKFMDGGFDRSITCRRDKFITE